LGNQDNILKCYWEDPSDKEGPEELECCPVMQLGQKLLCIGRRFALPVGNTGMGQYL